MTQARRFAWLVMLIADAGLLAWGAMAALAPDLLLGPGSKPILAAGFTAPFRAAGRPVPSPG
jgi:hypothetical protein